MKILKIRLQNNMGNVILASLLRIFIKKDNIKLFSVNSTIDDLNVKRKRRARCKMSNFKKL